MSIDLNRVRMLVAGVVEISKKLNGKHAHQRVRYAAPAHSMNLKYDRHLPYEWISCIFFVPESHWDDVIATSDSFESCDEKFQAEDGLLYECGYLINKDKIDILILKGVVGIHHDYTSAHEFCSVSAAAFLAPFQNKRHRTAIDGIFNLLDLTKVKLNDYRALLKYMLDMKLIEGLKPFRPELALNYFELDTKSCTFYHIHNTAAFSMYRGMETFLRFDRVIIPRDTGLRYSNIVTSPARTNAGGIVHAVSDSVMTWEMYENKILATIASSKGNRRENANHKNIFGAVSRLIIEAMTNGEQTLNPIQMALWSKDLPRICFTKGTDDRDLLKLGVADGKLNFEGKWDDKSLWEQSVTLRASNHLYPLTPTITIGIEDDVENVLPVIKTAIQNYLYEIGVCVVEPEDHEAPLPQLEVLDTLLCTLSTCNEVRDNHCLV